MNRAAYDNIILANPGTDEFIRVVSSYIVKPKANKRLTPLEVGNNMFLEKVKRAKNVNEVHRLFKVRGIIG